MLKDKLWHVTCSSSLEVGRAISPPPLLVEAEGSERGVDKDMTEALDNFIDWWVGWILRILVVGFPIWVVYEIVSHG